MTPGEKLVKAKIPCEETGIEIRHTMCDICTPGAQCGVSAYVKDGEIIKLEGTEGFPGSNGKLCTKGAAGRQYVYRKDRIRHPMKRTGPRGNGSFEQITWEEAFDIIEAQMKKVKARYGPESVIWFTGYPKWYRPWLHRLCNSFGGHNYMTESSTCFRAGRMANEIIFGRNVMPDMMGGPQLVVGWASNPLINAYAMGKAYFKAKEAGARIIIIDVRHTQAAEKLADLFLQPENGTDAVLAHAIANVIIQNGWQDQEFIDRYVHGYPEYKAMVSAFDPDTAERITGVAKADIRKAAEWIGTIKPCALSTNNGIAHHMNGFNTHRAIMALNVITGNFDKKGTILPAFDTFLEMGAGFATREEAFIEETRSDQKLPQIGELRFPLWNQMTKEGQSMDITRSILEETPYPIHALAAFGMNTRMFPETEKLKEALKKLDFMFCTDLFWTEACQYADIVLPVCSSYERGEVKCYPGGFINFTKPAIKPLFESRSDTDVITELARRLTPEDALLCKGYEETLRYIFHDNQEEIQAAKASDMPIKSCLFRPYIPGSYLKKGPETETGKLELYSEKIAAIDKSYQLDPLPSWYEGALPGHEKEYPFILMTGARLPHAIHSRAHKVPWLRSIRPDPMVDMNPDDAKRLHLSQNDPVELSSSAGTIRLLVNITEVSKEGELHLIHGYEEANATDLLSMNALDPYSGFPAYKQIRCNLRRLPKEAG